MSLSKYRINLEDELVILETIERKLLHLYDANNTLLVSLKDLIMQKRNDLSRSEENITGIWKD